MRVVPLFLSLVVSILFAIPSAAQQNAAPALQRDPQAIALAQQTLAAMGSSQALAFADSIATGQAQIFKPDGTSTVLPISKKSKGTTMVRTDLQRPEGTQSRIFNNGAAAIKKADGSVQPLIANNTVAERVEHIPALSLLTEWQSSTIEVRYIGADTINGRPVQVIALSYIPTSDPTRSNLYRSITQTIFYIDQATSLVTKIQYQNFAENDTNFSEKVEILFSNYQVVSGVSVPFQQSTYSNGHLLSTINFTSVAFNIGLAASDFNLPAGN